MDIKIETFIAEIRTRPAFIAAANMDPVYSAHLDAIERCLEFAYSTSELDPAAIEIFDEIACVAGRKELSVKARLDEIGRLLVRARDLGRAVQ